MGKAYRWPRLGIPKGGPSSLTPDIFSAPRKNFLGVTKLQVITTGSRIQDQRTCATAVAHEDATGTGYIIVTFKHNFPSEYWEIPAEPELPPKPRKPKSWERKLFWKKDRGIY